MTSALECSICLDGSLQSLGYANCPGAHTFHQACLQRWCDFTLHNQQLQQWSGGVSCPECRAPVSFISVEGVQRPVPAPPSSVNNNPGKWQDAQAVLAAVRQSGGRVLRFADPALQANRQIVLEAASRDVGALAYASSLLLRDGEFVLAAAQEHVHALAFADPALRSDRGFMGRAVQQAGGGALRHASAALQSDASLVLAAVQADGNALAFADPALRADSQVVAAAARQNVNALAYADEALRSDMGIVLEAVQKSGAALFYASDALKACPDVVSKAALQNVHSLQYASAALRTDCAFMSGLAQLRPEEPQWGRSVAYYALSSASPPPTSHTGLLKNR